LGVNGSKGLSSVSNACASNVQTGVHVVSSKFIMAKMRWSNLE
jgi:hypothetical protein